jgi:glycosyltransferase involved in cell wall biosynthesis
MSEGFEAEQAAQRPQIVGRRQSFLSGLVFGVLLVVLGSGFVAAINVQLKQGACRVWAIGTGVKRTTSILQVSPTGYSQQSVLGGGEKYVLYVDHALQRAAAEMQLCVDTAILSLDGAAATVVSDHGVKHFALAARAWDPFSISAGELLERLSSFDIIYIHQCLCHVGLYAAAHARLLGKLVIGADSGAGEYQLVKSNPDVARIFSAFHAYSRFAQNSFKEFAVPVHLIFGPVDTDVYRCTRDGERDPKMVLAIGRILPHKGFERIIDVLPPSLSLTIVGTPYDEAYLSFLKEKAAGKSVTFMKGVDDGQLRALIKRAGLFVHASTHFDYQGRYYHKPELLGLAPLEALSMGLRTLVSDAGSLPELADLPACWCFRAATDLSDLLQAYSAGTLEAPSPNDMHAAVTERYGLLQFGQKLLRAMGVC